MIHKRRITDEQDNDGSVKPKNRVMCPDCGKPKMLFESKRKAEDFIKWNGDSLDVRHENLRAYYCPSCCGWHISHQRHRSAYDLQTDNLIDAYRRQKQSLKKIDKIVRSQEYEMRVRYIEKESKRIFDDLPECVRNNSSKTAIKKSIGKYFTDHLIQEDGDLRTAIYNLWRKNFKHQRT